jgi:hypothetical protein
MKEIGKKLSAGMLFNKIVDSNTFTSNLQIEQHLGAKEERTLRKTLPERETPGSLRGTRWIRSGNLLLLSERVIKIRTRTVKKQAVKLKADPLRPAFSLLIF